MLWGGPEDVPAQETGAPIEATQLAGGDAAADSDLSAVDSARADSARADSLARNPSLAVKEAQGTVRNLLIKAAGVLPKLLLALLVIMAGALLTKLVTATVRRLSGGWQRTSAVNAIAAVAIWLFAIGLALSIVVGDARALVGSVGLLGLALSWALQSPIESFAGWLLNSFKAYYRVGDRIAVGDVFGDVYRIDVLNTTVWEAGGPDKPVQGAQPTGALITFPNSEMLRANIVNYTRYFEYIWDEVTVSVANESDIRYALEVTQNTARRVIGDHMRAPVERYRALLRRQRLAYDVADEPQVYVSPQDSWTDLTVRYLVGARERRGWASRLHVELASEHSDKAHAGRIIPAYPVRRVVGEGIAGGKSA